MRWLLVVVMCGCQSDRPAQKQVASQHWVLQSDWSGGKPPGTSYHTLLASDGKFTTTRDHVVTCDVVVPASNIDPISKAITDAKLIAGLPAEVHGGDVNTWNILTIDETPYAVPSTPAFTAANDAAMKVAFDKCPKQH